jgi:hypothetical protein
MARFKAPKLALTTDMPLGLISLPMKSTIKYFLDDQRQRKKLEIETPAVPTQQLLLIIN